MKLTSKSNLVNYFYWKNVAKFSAAKEKHKELFIIYTERDIIRISDEEILLSFKNNEIKWVD